MVVANGQIVQVRNELMEYVIPDLETVNSFVKTLRRSCSAPLCEPITRLLENLTALVPLSE